MRKFLRLMVAMVSIASACTPSVVRHNTDANQILLVKYIGGSDAVAEFYVRDKNGKFHLDMKGDAFVGKNGIDKTREGDAKTPTGTFNITTAFGIKPNPGTSVPYIDVKETTFACDEDCEFYNRIIDTRETGHDCHGEHMIKYTSSYAYGIAFNYNPENIYPKGSACFLHCKSDNPYTHGCVAVDEDFMVNILKKADSTMVIYIQ